MKLAKLYIGPAFTFFKQTQNYSIQKVNVEFGQ